MSKDRRNGHCVALPYSRARSMIREGDVLLFRGQGPVAWFIQKAGEGKYTHVGLASWHGDNLEIVEFREGNPIALIFGSTAGTGQGHAVYLESQVKRHSGNIDVYRPVAYHQTAVYDKDMGIVVHDMKRFDGRKITDALRRMTGTPYGWKTIFGFLKYNAFGLRLLYNTSRRALDDGFVDQNFPVCSTAVAQLFREYYVDLVPNKSDSSTEPSDISRSSLLNYIFTLEWDGDKSYVGKNYNKAGRS